MLCTGASFPDPSLIDLSLIVYWFCRIFYSVEIRHQIMRLVYLISEMLRILRLVLNGLGILATWLTFSCSAKLARVIIYKSSFNELTAARRGKHFKTFSLICRVWRSYEKKKK